MPSAMVTVVMVAVGLTATSGALAMQAQPQTAPRAPGGQGGTIGGGSRPQRPQPQGQRPVRDPRQPAVEGTATVRGRVVDGATGAAIPRAKVRTIGRDMRTARMATTDGEGVFTLTKVPSGPLSLSVEKATYMPANYPERRRTMRPPNFNVADGQTIDNISISLFRGGAITGRIIDAFGDPIENVMVQAIPVPQNNRSAPLNRGGMRAFQGSNDIGEFRISRLEPGQYFLLAMPQRRPNNPEDGANAPGRTYYPGVASIDQAQPITLERGGSMAGVDFQMLETTLTKVSGFVLNAKGGPAKGGHVSARSTNASKGTPSGSGGFMPDGGGSGIDMNGNFDLMLQPGEYILEAMSSPGDDGPRMNGGEMNRGQVRLVVAGESINGVTISTGAGGTVSGRFVFNGRSAPPTSFGAFNIGFGGPNGSGTGDECRSFNRANVNPDGTFSAENMWGTCQIRGGGMAKGWAFEAVMHNGNDITNRVIEFGAGQSISGVEIVFSDRAGDLTVTVSDERGTPIQDYVTIVFPVDKEKWGDQRFLRTQTMTAPVNPGGQALSNTRITSSSLDPSIPLVMQNMTSGQNSTLRTLLAGDYFAVAVDDAAYEDLRDVEFLERLSQVATRLTVSPGGAGTLQLRRVKLPE